MPFVIALRMPCPESGSSVQAASPTATHLSPRTFERQPLPAGRSLGGHSIFAASKRRRSRTVFAKAEWNPSSPASPSCFTMSPSVRKTARARFAGRTVEYHQPSRTGSRSSRVSRAESAAHEKKQQRPTIESSKFRRAPFLVANTARRPVASTTNEHGRRCTEPRQRKSRSQPAAVRAASLKRDSRNTVTPRDSAALRSIRSNLRRSKCQPRANGVEMKSSPPGSPPPQVDKVPKVSTWF